MRRKPSRFFGESVVGVVRLKSKRERLDKRKKLLHNLVSLLLKQQATRKQRY